MLRPSVINEGAQGSLLTIFRKVYTSKLLYKILIYLPSQKVQLLLHEDGKEFEKQPSEMIMVILKFKIKKILCDPNWISL